MVEFIVISLCLLSLLLGVGSIKATTRLNDDNFEYCKNEKKAKPVADDYRFRTQR